MVQMVHFRKMDHFDHFWSDIGCTWEMVQTTLGCCQVVGSSILYSFPMELCTWCTCMPAAATTHTTQAPQLNKTPPFAMTVPNSSSCAPPPQPSQCPAARGRVAPPPPRITSLTHRGPTPHPHIASLTQRARLGIFGRKPWVPHPIHPMRHDGHIH